MRAAELEALIRKRQKELDEFLSSNEGIMHTLHPNADKLCDMACDAMSEIQSLKEDLAEMIREEESYEDECFERIRLGEGGY